MDKDTTQKVLEQNQKKIEKILRQNGVDPNNVAYGGRQRPLVRS